MLSTYDSLINKSTVGKLLLLDNEASNEGKPKTTTESETPVNQAVATPLTKAPPSASLIDEQLLPLGWLLCFFVALGCYCSCLVGFCCVGLLFFVIIA